MAAESARHALMMDPRYEWTCVCVCVRVFVGWFLLLLLLLFPVLLFVRSLAV